MIAHMQQKSPIDMLLFGKKSPLLFGSQVDDNMFTAAEVCEERKKEDKEEEVKEALNA